MEIEKTPIAGVQVITPKVFPDPRGYFMESYQRERFEAAGIPDHFVQDNLSYSTRGTLRGLHFQNPCQQAKLVQVIAGEIFDVAVDIRLGSTTFGHWYGLKLSSTNHRQLFIAAGLAHGFCVLSEKAHVVYKCTDYYAPEYEGGILWSDPSIGIDWPVAKPLLSEKDQAYPLLQDLPPASLPGVK